MKMISIVRRVPWFFLLGIITALVFGKAYAGGDGVLLEGPEVKMTEADLNRVLSLLPQEAQTEILSDESKFEEVIFSTYRVMVAANKGEKLIEDDEVIKAKLWHMRANMLAEAYINKIIGDSLNPEALKETAREYYETHKSQYIIPKKYKISHIQFDKKGGDKAREVLSELKAGKLDFDAAVTLYSIDPTNKRTGGELGWVKKGEVVEPIYSAIQGTESLGELLGPVETQFGWHIVKILEIQDARTLSYEESEEKIIERIEQKRRKEIAEGLMAKMNAEIKSINRQQIMSYRKKILAK